MEINAKIAALDEDIKVLKGEVKTILKEIRTVLLSQDNPFASGSGGPVFKPQERPVKPSALDSEPETEEPETPTEAAAPVPEVATPPPAVAPVPAEAAPPPASQVAPPQAEPPATAPMSAAQPVPAEPAPAWSLMTIASMAAWAEDAAAALGSQRLQIILDLAEFAGLVPEELKEALLKLTKLGKSKGAAGEDGATSVNQSLVVLRQLEAILHNEDSDELSARRGARRHGRIR
ncbi:MAG: hypothetical protein WBF37_11165 [Dehalococcoidia bacterium]